MLTVMKLRVGDLVRDTSGERGQVVGFTRDHVFVRWNGGEAMRMTDEQLRMSGLAKVSPFDEAEDTEPGWAP